MHKDNLPTLVILVAIISALALVGLMVESQVITRVVIDTLINLVFVIGLSIFIGNSGILSFGHASFAAIGGYSAAWFTLPLTAKKIFLPQLPAFVLATQVSLPVGAAIGMLTAALSGAVIGSVIVRLSGVAASIATLAWLAIVNNVFSNADAYTKGTSSLVGLPLVVGLGTAFTAALFALVVAFIFKYSRSGLMLQASREDEVAAMASGISVRTVRYVAFVLSAAIVALGGVLQGHFLGILSIGQFYLEFTFLTLAMLVLGGMRSLSGAVIGTIIIAVVSELLRMMAGGFTIGAVTMPATPGSREIFLGLIMLAILIMRPKGIMNRSEFTWRKKGQFSPCRS